MPSRSLVPVRESMLVFGQPDLHPEDIAEVVATLESRWIGTGPRAARFERDFAAYVGAAEAVALNSCTSALMLSLQAARIGPGDEVITTPLTFCATVNAILHAGATPVLADVCPDSMNIDPREIERRITDRTRAVLIVHLAGRPCAMDEIVAITQRHGLLLIEDCAHAIETTWRGQHAGTFGDFGCFSFYATKNLTTGEGGMVIGKSAEDLARIKVMALHGLSRDAWNRFGDQGYRHYLVVDAGYKCNMTDLQAAIGMNQIGRLEASSQRRRAIWNRYDSAFAGLPVACPAPCEPESRHALHLYTLLIDPARAGMNRDAFIAAMTAQNIGVGVHYVSLPEHPYYQDRLGWRAVEWPIALRLGQQTVSLPLSSALSDRDVTDVITAVERAFA